MKSFKFLFVQYLLLSITIAWACDCGRRSPPPGRMSSFSPGTLLLKETFGYVPGHGQLAELTIEESSNIFELTSPSALKFKINGRADKFIHRLNLYAANDKIDSKNLKIGDWIEFPALKIEISDLTLNKKYASGYSLKGYTPNSKNKKHKINLAYQIDIIGGYKRSIDSTEYIPESEVKDGDLYLLEILHKDGNTKDILQRHKIYRFTDKEGKLSDGLWYYDDGFKKTKIRKTSYPLDKLNPSKGTILKQFISSKTYTEETSFISYKSITGKDERVAKNGRIRRGENENNDEMHLADLAYAKTIISADGTPFNSNSRKFIYDFDPDKNSYGKLKADIYSNTHWSLMEYNPVYEGDMRTYSSINKSELIDKSEDGELGIEDLENTMVLVKSVKTVDFQGTRHTKKITYSKAKASFCKDLSSDGYHVLLSDESIVSEENYEHIRTEDGGLIEKITTMYPNGDGTLQASKVIGYKFEDLGMGTPISAFSTIMGEKTINVHDGGYVGFSDENFLSANGPNYLNIPSFDSNSARYPVSYKFNGIESNENTTIILPWGGSYYAENFTLVSGKSELEVYVDLDFSGNTVYIGKYVYINGGFTLVSWTYNDYNTQVYPFARIGTYNSNGTYSTESLLNEYFQKTITDEYGKEIQYGYSDSEGKIVNFKRERGVISALYGNQKDKIVVYTNDLSGVSSCGCGEAPSSIGANAESHFISSQIGGSGSANPASDSQLVFQTYEYILSSGFRTLSIDKYGVATRHDVSSNSENFIVKNIPPGFTLYEPYSTEIIRKSDMKRLSLSGVGVVNEYIEYDGQTSKTTVYGTPNSGNFKTEVYNEDGKITEKTDPLGTSTYTYSPEGNILSEIDKYGIKTTYTYDSFGDLQFRRDSALNPGTSLWEQISETEYAEEYRLEDGIIWHLSSSSGNGNSRSVKTRLTGFPEILNNGNLVYAEAITISASNKSIVRESLNRTGKLRFVEKSDYVKRNDVYIKTAQEKVTYLNGQKVEILTEKFSENENVVFSKKQKIEYDDIGRILRIKIFMGNTLYCTKEYFYYPSENVSFEEDSISLLALGRLKSVIIRSGDEIQGQAAEYLPRNSKNAGLACKIIYGTSFNSDGSVLSGIPFNVRYNDMGLVERIWGYGTAPIIYSYDSFGRMTSMCMFKSSDEAAVLFNSDEWPTAYTTSHLEAEKTFWNYENSTGLLLSKTDALNNVTSFSYDSHGRKISETKASGRSISYSYDYKGNLSAETSSTTTYSYAYDQNSNIVGVNSALGNYSYQYNSGQVYPTLEVFPNGYTLRRIIDDSLNITSIELKDENGTSLYAVSYGYRDNEITSVSAENKELIYNRNLLGVLESVSLDSSAQINYNVDKIGNMKKISYKVGNAELISDTYTTAPIGKLSSSQFSLNGVPVSTWRYTYLPVNYSLGSAKLYRADGNELFDDYSSYEYKYDISGNLTKRKESALSSLWTELGYNLNNQLISINIDPAYVYPIRGRITPEATLNIIKDGALQTFERDNTIEDFTYAVPAYLDDPKFLNIKLEAVLESDEDNASPSKTLFMGNFYLPPRQESFQYDLDGNLLSDSRWNYTWNDMGRLASIQTTDNAVLNGIPNQRFEYYYDYIGRKVLVKEYSKGEGNNNWSLISTNRRYYDMYNLIYETIEYTDPNKLTDVRKYYFSNGIKGGLHNSGAGIGGLRMVNINGILSYVFNDRNGNVQALLAANSSGDFNANDLLAEYEYDAFGNIRRMQGLLASKNPLRYSTQYIENITGLYSYILRHYSPRTARWLSRDPYGESGNPNLYLFSNNDPINNVDLLGLESIPVCSGRYRKCTINSKDWPCDYEYRTKKSSNSKVEVNACGSNYTAEIVPDYSFVIDPHVETGSVLWDLIEISYPRLTSPVSFEEACNKHDECYGHCGNKRNTCDDKFLDDMRNECDKHPPVLKTPCRLQADIYYAAVFSFGWIRAYDSGQDHDCYWDKCCLSKGD